MTFLNKINAKLDPFSAHAEEVKKELQQDFTDLDKPVNDQATGMFHFPIKNTEDGALFVSISFTGGKPKKYVTWVQKGSKKSQVFVEAHDVNGLKENVKKLLDKVKNKGILS